MQNKQELSLEERKKLPLFSAYDDYFRVRDEDLYNKDFERKLAPVGEDPLDPVTLWHDMMKVVCGASEERGREAIRMGMRFLIDNLKETYELEIIEDYLRQGMDALVKLQAEDIAQEETEIEQEILVYEKQEAAQANQIQ